MGNLLRIRASTIAICLSVVLSPLTPVFAWEEAEIENAFKILGISRYSAPAAINKRFAALARESFEKGNHISIVELGNARLIALETSRATDQTIIASQNLSQDNETPPFDDIFLERLDRAVEEQFAEAYHKAFPNIFLSSFQPFQKDQWNRVHRAMVLHPREALGFLLISAEELSSIWDGDQPDSGIHLLQRFQSEAATALRVQLQARSLIQPDVYSAFETEILNILESPDAHVETKRRLLRTVFFLPFHSDQLLHTIVDLRKNPALELEARALLAIRARTGLPKSVQNRLLTQRPRLGSLAILRSTESDLTPEVTKALIDYMLSVRNPTETRWIADRFLKRGEHLAEVKTAVSALAKKRRAEAMHRAWANELIARDFAPEPTPDHTFDPILHAGVPQIVPASCRSLF